MRWRQSTLQERESAVLKVRGQLFERESPAALVVEWTALWKGVDSSSEDEWTTLPKRVDSGLEGEWTTLQKRVDSRSVGEWTALRKRVDSGLEGEWTILRKRIDSGSKVVGSTTERLDRACGLGE